MNITAALVTGATVTVYFVGLVHFQNVSSSGGDVIVPLTTMDSMHGEITLAQHRADIVVTGAGTSSAGCPGGTYVPADTSATPPTPATCTIRNLSQKKIELPASTSTAPFNADSFNVPHLQSICTDPPRSIGALKDEYKEGGAQYAARLHLDKGTLTAARNGDAWESKLEIGNASNTFKVGGKAVALSGDATIKIINEPVHLRTTSDEAHFFWYYEMYDNAAPCDGLPARVTTTTAARGPQGIDVPPYATGVGCSNTQYP